MRQGLFGLRNSGPGPFLERYSKEGGEKGVPRCRRRSARFPSPAASPAVERRGNRVDRWLAYI